MKREEMAVRVKKLKEGILRNITNLNNLAKKYKPLIDLIGITSGIVLLFLTYSKVSNSKKLLDLRTEQESLRRSPSWAFNFIDNKKLSVKPYTPGVQLQYVKYHFKESVVPQKKIEAFEDNFTINLNLINSYLKNKILAESYNGKTEIHEQNILPVAVEFNYIQDGTSYNIFGYFALHYYLVRNSKTRVIVSYKGVVFDKYFENLEDIKNEIENDH